MSEPTIKATTDAATLRGFLNGLRDLCYAKGLTRGTLMFYVEDEALLHGLQIQISQGRLRWCESKKRFRYESAALSMATDGPIMLHLLYERDATRAEMEKHMPGAALPPESR